MTPQQYEKAGEIIKEIKTIKHDLGLTKRPGRSVCAYTSDGIRLRIPEETRKFIEILAVRSLEDRLTELENNFKEL